MTLSPIVGGPAMVRLARPAPLSAGKRLILLNIYDLGKPTAGLFRAATLSMYDKADRFRRIADKTAARTR
jgi:hypothetical protein